MSPLHIICATVVVLACLAGAVVTRDNDETAAGFGLVALVTVALTALGVWKLR